MRWYVGLSDRSFQKVDIGTACGTLGSVSLSISRDCDHVILTLIKFIRYGSEAIRSRSSRRSGITFVRNSESSHVIGYLGCTNAITGSSVTWMIHSGLVWPQLVEVAWTHTSTGTCTPTLCWMSLSFNTTKRFTHGGKAKEKEDFVTMNTRATLSESDPIGR